MSRSMEARLQRLRGALAAEEPGARGIERVARNPECTRLRAVLLAGIAPATAAEKILGIPKSAMSPFALALGNQFERRVLAHGAAELFTAYNEKNLLGSGESKVVSIEDLAPGSSLTARRRRESETLRFLDLKLAGDSRAANLIIKPRLYVRLAGVPHPIEPDYLVASDADAFYRVGELKSYADRVGKTDPADVRSACRQAAVGTLALRQRLSSLRGPNPEIAEDRADLLLRAPGSFKPRIYARMKIEAELASIERAVESAPRDLDELEGMLAPGASLDDPATLAGVPNNYRPSCKEHCPMWQHCREQALRVGQPVLLGDQSAEVLAAAGTLTRAIDLLNGTGRPAANAAEQALAAQLRDADALLRRAANG